MFKLLSQLLDSFSKGLLGRVMTGAGITFASTVTMTSIIQSYISKIKSMSNGIMPDILGVLHLGAIDYALSVILSAVVARVSLNSLNLSIMKKK